MSELAHRRLWANVLDWSLFCLGVFAMISGVHRALALQRAGLATDIESVGVFAVGMVMVVVLVPFNVVAAPAISGSSFGRDLTGVRLLALDGSKATMSDVARRAVLTPRYLVVSVVSGLDGEDLSVLDRASRTRVARQVP